MLHCDFLKFTNRVGFVHDGLLFPGSPGGVGVIHVHGSLQNFYCTGFIPALARAYQAAGITFLTFNLTCHDAVAEGEFVDGHVEYVGGAFSVFDTCRDDIDAAISVIADRCPRLVLQGHSLGCDRVVDYLLKRREDGLEAILLSPCDSYQLQKRYLAGKSPEEQAFFLQDMECRDNFELLPPSTYGVNQGAGWSYPIPTTRRALLSIMNGPPFKLFNLESPTTYSIPNRTLTVIGRKDALTAGGIDQMVGHLAKRFPNLTTVTDPESDHSFAHRELWLATQLVNWVNRRSSPRRDVTHTD